MPPPGMTPSGMSAAIKAELEGVFGAPFDGVRLQEFCDAMGEAIVTYIQANAFVGPGTYSTPPSGGSVSGDGFPVN
jgi:hypothetical protein